MPNSRGTLRQLDRVTITGADDSVTAEDLITISQEFPFVEWGILFSRRLQDTTLTQERTPRYPSPAWILHELPLLDEAGVQLSAHLCGGWVRALALEGDFAWKRCNPRTSQIFPRIQLNFHAERQFRDTHHEFAAILEREEEAGHQIILQVDGVNDTWITQLVIENGIGVPLFDTSHGAGVSPSRWPKAWPKTFCGYAGGLSPTNVVDEITRIREVACGERIWIDMERQVRTDDDRALDLDKVCRVLTQCARFVV